MLRVAVRSASVSWVLILMVVGLVGVGTAAGIWLVPTAFPKQAAPTQSPKFPATVISSGNCADPESRDQLEYTDNGTKRQVRLNGCGNHSREVLTVRKVPGDDGTVAIASTNAGNGRRTDIRTNLRFVLFALSGVAGALYALLLRRSPLPDHGLFVKRHEVPVAVADS
ncbi:hypothetical protein D5S17_31255 [Pseudonocardiaceae bacterium YIM PH 21723]|nr:hypothetical protein D5S17_31255 [Pseudonocardiaceae bacterium YIM PH 21723]